MNNEYQALVTKLSNEIIEGITKEAGIKDIAGKAGTYFNAGASKAKGATNLVIDKLKNVRTSAAEKAKDAAQKMKDSKAYGMGRGMLGSTKVQTGLAAASGFGAGVGAGVGASKLSAKRKEREKEAAELNDFIEKVAAHNNISVEDASDILERAATAFHESRAALQECQITKEAAEEAYEAAEQGELEASAQLEAAVQVMEELGIPVDELVCEEDETDE